MSFALAEWASKVCLAERQHLLPKSSQQPAHTATLGRAGTCLALFVRRASGHQPVQSQVLPGWFPGLLLGALNAKRSVLIRNDIILVVGIQRLVLRRNIDLLGR